MDENMTYEQAIERLKQIITQLNAGNVTLDDSKKLFEEGVTLTKFCEGRLNEVVQQIKAVDKTTQEEISFNVNPDEV